jgi:hypothetical protein
MSGGKPNEPLDSVYHSAACTIPWSPQKKYVTIIGVRQGILSDDAPCRVAVPVPDLATSSALHSSARVPDLATGIGSTHSAGHTPCPAERKATEAPVDAEVDWHSGMVGQRHSDDERVT